LSKLGMADLGLATLNDMRENAGMIASLNRNIPLIADADTGFVGEKLHCMASKTLAYLVKRPTNGGSNHGAIYTGWCCGTSP